MHVIITSKLLVGTPFPFQVMRFFKAGLASSFQSLLCIKVELCPACLVFQVDDIHLCHPQILRRLQVDLQVSSHCRLSWENARPLQADQAIRRLMQAIQRTT